MPVKLITTGFEHCALHKVLWTQIADYPCCRFGFGHLDMRKILWIHIFLIINVSDPDQI